MSRYKLMEKYPEEKAEKECLGQRKTTKKEIDGWISDNVKACGLDWRVGYVVKLLGDKSVYTWRWIKNDKEVGVL